MHLDIDVRGRRLVDRSNLFVLRQQEPLDGMFTTIICLYL
jgi:hypothetical protein